MAGRDIAFASHLLLGEAGLGEARHAPDAARRRRAALALAAEESEIEIEKILGVEIEKRLGSVDY